MTVSDDKSLPPDRPERVTFSQDFKRFFMRGLAALLPTLITLWLLVWAWDFLWGNLGRHLIWLIKRLWPNSDAARNLQEGDFATRLVGVLLAILLVYIVGFFVGNLIGRTFWKLGETLVIRIPVVRAIYPAVKQITDWLLTDRRQQFQSSRVVAVQPHQSGIWSIGLITGQGLRAMDDATGQEMVMVFLPNSPAAFSGYVVVVPRNEIVELPLSVEDAMRLFISGGVILPGGEIKVGGKVLTAASRPAAQPAQPGPAAQAGS